MPPTDSHDAEDPSDLLLHRAEADLLDDDGLPDLDKIAEAGS